MVGSILFLLLALFICNLLWKQFLSPLVKYIRAGLTLGFGKVALIYKPLTSQIDILQWSSKHYGNSFGFYLNEVRKNPDLRMIIARFQMGSPIIVVDPEMIKKLTN